MSGPEIYFLKHPTPEALRAALAPLFQVTPAEVFVYFDAEEVLGSINRAADAALEAAYYASPVRVLVRANKPDSGPIAGWLRVERIDLDARMLARALARALGEPFIYPDPIPDPRDHPIAEAAQIEVSADGTERKVWIYEFGSPDGDRTELTDRD
ncbi:MAG: hypothetical protein JNJ73_02265 [Hyphomonadaceae bacterium]|nr:hypothetical protein [Hyphomonadaceae bacterium]